MKLLIYLNSIDDYASSFLQKFLAYSPRLISAFVILIIGLYAIRFINRLVKRIMLRRALDPTLSKFLADLLLWALRLLLFVTFISRLGIETSSFVAILGAAGLAVGLSLQGSLSNFAGGMLIILFKPFRVGDYIEAQGAAGVVSEIQIFVTKLITANNQTIFVPNGALSNGTITNYSVEEIRRADLSIAISYDTDIRTARLLLLSVVENHQHILKKPAPEVSVKSMDNAAIVLAVRPWSKNEHFGTMVSDVLEQGKMAFDQAGIKFQPYVAELAR
ncbi:MAG: mechanosensitive ion channel [Flavobacterium sp.]|nr:MAG: mechanosensitive ion channel [Flavobacterium sp.]